MFDHLMGYPAEILCKVGIIVQVCDNIADVIFVWALHNHMGISHCKNLKTCFFCVNSSCYCVGKPHSESCMFIGL